MFLSNGKFIIDVFIDKKEKSHKVDQGLDPSSEEKLKGTAAGASAGAEGGTKRGGRGVRCGPRDDRR